MRLAPEGLPAQARHAALGMKDPVFALSLAGAYPCTRDKYSLMAIDRVLSKDTL
jgi:hypothetical protein